MAGSTRVGSNGIFEIKTRPPSLALPAPPNLQQGLSGMLFFRGIQMERRLWHTANTICIFSSPFTHLKEPQVQTWGFFCPLVTSSRNGVCACCIRGMGWWPAAAWKTLGISVLPTEAPQHPARWLPGSTASPQGDAFGNVYLVRYYSNLGVQIQLEHIAVYSSQAACSSRQKLRVQSVR